MASSVVTSWMAGRNGLALLLLAALSPIAGHAADCGGSNITSLDALNCTVSGRVLVNTPFSLPCFSSYEGQAVEPNATACQAVQENYASPTFRTEFPGAYMNFQDEMCSSDPADQCVLDPTDPKDPLAYVGQDCKQGDVPSYYLEVTDVCDVQAAFSFARSSGTPVVIKNSGHDYLSHSSQKGALALWTRNLQRLEYHDAFIPEGCSAGAGQLAITTGAGVNCDQAYKFANENNVTILCAYSETVGISGGWVQTAGHSVLSPVYGLGVDRVLEYQVVTPDGQDLIANACQNQDLFWALRGGGGGTFGVVMQSTHLVEPPIPMVAADIAFTSNSTTLLEWMGIMMEEAAPWADAGWGGHITGSSLIYVNPILSMDAAQESMKNASDYATSQGGSVVFQQFDSFYGFYEEYVAANAVTVGNTHIAGSRLIPRAVLDNEDGRTALMGFLEVIIAAGISPYVPVSMPTIYKPQGQNTTSTTPAFYTSLWELGVSSTWTWNSTLAQRLAAVEALNNRTAQLEAVTPGGGAYMNEANPFTSDWQESWWGEENYASLLAIKNRYDPDRLLRCWRCVGWEESDVQDSCFEAFNN
jgi:FAD/FMN-containing dehydrogenase